LKRRLRYSFATLIQFPARAKLRAAAGPFGACGTYLGIALERVKTISPGQQNSY
jgi:hypothetical protein